MGIPLPPPWVLFSLLLGFTKNVQDIKDIGALGWTIMRGRGENAKCQLCDKLVGVVLKSAELDDMSEGGGVDCGSICFKVGSCIRTCEKITSAMANSTGFPCIAAGLCPAEDEFGDVSCQWSYKSMGCEPVSSCEYKFPKCELRSGMKKWKQVNHLVSSHLGAFDDAFRHRKRCSEPDAGPYCIREAEGLGMLAEWGGLALTFLGGAVCSVRAIETPGGDDDRQWLTFWMIMMIFFLAERFTDVLLSQVFFYYELKFVAVVWLMFWEGADKIYRTGRKSLKTLSRLAPFLFPRKRQLSEKEAIALLPRPMRRDARRVGLRRLMEGFASDEDVIRQFGPAPLIQLWDLWNKVDPRYLTLHLIRADGIPPMDNNAATDAYCVAYLVPPSGPSDEACAAAASVMSEAGLTGDKSDDDDGAEAPEAAAAASGSAPAVGKMASVASWAAAAAKGAHPAGRASPRLVPSVPPVASTAQVLETAAPPAFPWHKGQLTEGGDYWWRETAGGEPEISLTEPTPSTKPGLTKPGDLASLAVHTMAATAPRPRRASADSPAALLFKQPRSRRASTESVASVDSVASTASTPASSVAGTPASPGQRREAARRPFPESSGWSRLRSTQRAASLTTAWERGKTSWQRALTALTQLRVAKALTILVARLRSGPVGQLLFGLQLSQLKAAMSGGPVGQLGQYGGTYSRVRAKTLHPVWNQYLELRLEGGELDEESGEYDNRDAPYTCLRIELWDRDRLSRDDFIGEVFVRLCPLMDGRVHAYELPLRDPEGKCQADGGLTGTITFELQYES